MYANEAVNRPRGDSRGNRAAKRLRRNEIRRGQSVRISGWKREGRNAREKEKKEEEEEEAEEEEVKEKRKEGGIGERCIKRRKEVALTSSIG